jgi:hypothetical protein
VLNPAPEKCHNKHHNQQQQQQHAGGIVIKSQDMQATGKQLLHASDRGHSNTVCAVCGHCRLHGGSESFFASPRHVVPNLFLLVCGAGYAFHRQDRLAFRGCDWYPDSALANTAGLCRKRTGLVCGHSGTLCHAAGGLHSLHMSSPASAAVAAVGPGRLCPTPNVSKCRMSFDTIMIS